MTFLADLSADAAVSNSVSGEFFAHDWKGEQWLRQTLLEDAHQVDRVHADELARGVARAPGDSDRMLAPGKNPSVPHLLLVGN